MLKLFPLFPLILIAKCLSAGEWTVPVNVSRLGNDTHADFTIDNNNIIHCVWSHRLEVNHRKILYSKSEDGGETWSKPFDISLNDDFWASFAHICADSKNNLYVSYDYNIGNVYKTEVHLLFFNGQAWSMPDTVSIGYLGADRNCLVIDNNNRVYVFWRWGETIYYRYKDNSVWSDVIRPFNDDNNYYLWKVIADDKNNLHCAANYKKSYQSSYAYRAAYFNYNYTESTWSDVTILSDDTASEYFDIDLDSDYRPHIVWSQDIAPYTAGTFYSYFDRIAWTEPVLIGKNRGRIEMPAFTLDENDQPHFVINIYNQKVHLKFDLLYYYNAIAYEGKLLEDTTKFIGKPKLICKGNILYLVYSKSYDQIITDVYFRKKDLTSTSVNHYKDTTPLQFQLNQNYPNPFNNSTIIQYTLKSNIYANITIFDIKGTLVKTLLNMGQRHGIYKIIWDGTDSSGNSAGSGVYFCRLKAGEQVLIKKMLLIR